MDADSPDWALAAAFVNPMPDREDEVKRISVMRRAAIRNRCRLTSRWNTFVHCGGRCAVRSQNCGCWIPKGAPECQVHPRQIKTRQPCKRRWGRMLDSDPDDEPAAPPRPPRPPPRPTSPSPPPSSPPARPPTPREPEPPVAQGSWGGLLTRMKPDAPKGALRRVKPKHAPAPAPRKEEPAGGRRAWLPREEWLASKHKQDVADDGFDIRVHGYWLTRSRGLVYRCQDGRELPATGVDAFGA